MNKTSKAFSLAFEIGWSHYQEGKHKSKLPSGQELANALIGKHPKGVEDALRRSCSTGFWYGSYRDKNI